jgi:D-amino-acid dehydrogenase
MAANKSIVIIGGGVIGLCTAYYALQKGHRVTILERGAADHDSCGAQNAGMIVPSHFVPLAAPGMVSLGMKMLLNPEGPFSIRPRLSWDLIDWGWKFWRACNANHVARSGPVLRDLSLLSRKSFEEFSDLPDSNFGLVKKGLMMLCASEHTLQHEAALAASAKELGIDAQVLSAAETAKLEPGIQMKIAGAVYFPQDCHLDPGKFLASLTRALKKSGAEFSYETEVTGWRSSEGRIDAVKTTRGEFGANEFVLACGSWSPQTLRGLNLALPMQSGKGYSLTLAKPKQLPSICSILTEARVAVTPMGESLRFAGTMEITGLDESINQRRVNGILKSVPAYFPAFHADDFRSLPVWRGLRPCSPDGMPYIGRFRRYENLCAATGHAMLGLSLGPATGRVVADILSGDKPSIDVSALSPDRFS